MQWSDVVRRPSERHLRQFAGLFLIVFGAIAGWRWTTGRDDVLTMSLATIAAVVGVTGLIAPAIVRPIYSGWMIVAFPIGWTVSRLMLAATFYGVMTPIALAFRIGGRDALRKRRQTHATFWLPKRQSNGAREYFRQS